MNAILKYRLATKHDLADIVRMLADDTLGATREKIGDKLPESYINAFENILADLSQELTSEKKRPDAIRFYESCRLSHRMKD